MSSSHLTRVVFRRMIANEPIVSRACLYRTTRPRIILKNGVRSLPQAQRRTFFSMFKQERKIKDLDMPAGLEIMTEFTFARERDLRPPKTKDLARAFSAFFVERKGKFEEFHVFHAHGVLKYLLENPQEDGTPWLSNEHLYKDVFTKILEPERLPQNAGKAHIEFGRTILNELVAKPEKQKTAATEEVAEGKESEEEVNFHLRMINLLSNCGASVEAREIAFEKFPFDPESRQRRRNMCLRTWKVVIAGLAREANVENMMETDEKLLLHEVPLTAGVQKELVVFYAQHDNLERAKFWYSRPVVSQTGSGPARPISSTSTAMLKACALTKDLAYGKEIVATLLEHDMQEKESWDAVFLWSVAIGKGPDEVDRMMNVLLRRQEEARQKDPKLEMVYPDTDTINALVEFCMSKQDPYSAERYITMGEKRGILPDERTYRLQMQYRISTGDIDGARAAYFNLQGSFSGAAESVAVINKLIQVLCISKQHHFDELMAMVDDLHERKASFDPETVAAVVLLHLRRGELHDAMDLLQVHSAQYSPEQRSIIQKSLLTFILDSETTSTADAWDGYQILRNVFPETPRADRIPIMNEFFARDRSDMACHVFFHMRNHLSEAHAANHAVYVAAFSGFARCADAESLELAHNQLKLDLSVDLDTQLRNALMLAYAATKQNRKALAFWREICESKEGPSYNSIAIAFRGCEGMHWGGEHAKAIWEKLIQQDVEIDKKIWVAYMCAIARNHHHDEALALIETVQEEYGWVPDLEILANWYNMTANSAKQEHVEKWIRQHYPHVWHQMEDLGYWVTMDGFGYRQYNVNRDLEP